MIVYVYDQYTGNRTASLNTEQLIRLALKQHAKETGFNLDLDQNPPRICRTQKGKPYVENYPAHISVSHSDKMWVCAVGHSESGVDIQNKTHSNYAAISRRFFQPEEQKAVEIGGIEVFMAIWCRKEAFIKFYGMTIGETIDWLDVAKDGKPTDSIEYLDQLITFTEINVHQDFLCVVASDTKDEIWIRQIQAN